MRDELELGKRMADALANPPAFPKGYCKTCPAEVIWTVTEKGARMPVDLEPIEGGNLFLSQIGNGPVRSKVIGKGPGRRYVSHFATCPQSKEHRKPRG